VVAFNFSKKQRSNDQEVEGGGDLIPNQGFFS
jgi:hypothetical protein